MRSSKPLLASSLFVAIALAAGAGCSTGDEGAAAGDDELRATDMFGGATSMFGNDRVGRALKDNLGAVPADYPAFEQLFKVGRACARQNSKEIFIVEEAQTRSVDGNTTATAQLMPRAVITGCNTGDTANPASIKESYSLMAALISDPGNPGAEAGDTMSMGPLEVMAFDDSTGLYNFYVFDQTGPGKPGTVRRLWRGPDGVVNSRVLVGGETTASPTEPFANNACFRCHANGGPLMNELREPWSNWISPKKRIPVSTMSGVTKELVDSASLADKLETIIREGTQAYVNGLGPRKGWLNRVRDGRLPGGLPKLFESVFCQTELNYVSADTTRGLPLEVFFEPAVTSGPMFVYPRPTTQPAPIPFLFPVRSELDYSAERTLIRRGYLTEGMAIAIRLLDDENDIFSPQRCSVFREDLAPAMARAIEGEVDRILEPADVKFLVKAAIEKRLSSIELPPARRAYLEARLNPGPYQAKLDAYNAELTERFAALDKSVEPREAARKAEARAMFPDPSNPLPILDLE